MLNLLTSDQSRQADKYTIQHLSMQSIDLMERAALAFSEAFIKNYPDKMRSIAVYCGTGNNGGDGLAIARLLYRAGYRVDVKIARFSGKSSSDFDGNLARLMSQGIIFDEFRKIADLREEQASIIIDALLGTGLNKPLDGEWLTLVEWLNSLGRTVVSVDIPTGFKAEGPISKHDVTVKSELTISFQRPKINFLLPDSALCIKRFEVVDIGLDEGFIQALSTPYAILTDSSITRRLKKRKPFSHKGTFGHALIVAGGIQTMGAALLCAEACLNTGTGLTTASIPSEGLTALNIRIPEAMASLRYKNVIPADLAWEKYNAIAIGPGLGVSDESKLVLKQTLNSFRKPIVFDADAINLLASNPDLVNLVPKLSVLTPHVKEFDRLFGEHSNWWERLETGMNKAKELDCIIILKNRYSILFTPEGKCVFNPTGTPAMSSGGMGDVLTGMITSFLAQGYKPEDAAYLAVFIHGKAGQELSSQNRAYVVTAGSLLKDIPQAIGKMI
ncbi:NAD(P)H-hydrate dehydratase [Paradesertivirga mongoliensis]|uniref:Bifunctional NAD(P)H-hydrate repair enzyme n=1 Tax=Paradesertivirga mongoliensis TaxID=2100740 RepID=A0ABW4ZJ76_9SPHI|nr:NAD(P)H-hydrate dehydratase [Pedobacter mongoliensis]